VTRTVTVLVIACPHALGLAILLVIAISTEQAARAGVLIKNRMALEHMRTMDVVLLDKTNTLTTGAPDLKDIATAPGEESAEHQVEGQDEHQQAGSQFYHPSGARAAEHPGQGPSPISQSGEPYGTSCHRP
jgi:cation transport ATPase